MKRSVLAGVAAILAGGAAFAQMDPEPAAPDAAVSPAASPFIAAQDPTSFMWNDIIGRPLFNPEDEALGTISGLIFDQNGTIIAITVGVGGFLGIGEKIIAVDIDALDVTLGDDGNLRWILSATADDLTAAPDFTTLQQAEIPQLLPIIGAGAAPMPTPEPEPMPAPAPAEPAPAPAEPAPAPEPMPAPEPGPAAPAPEPAPPAAEAPAPAGAEPAPGGDADMTAMMTEGEEIYVANCAVCHGAEGEGTVGPALAGNQALTAADGVAHQILVGGEQMPAFGETLDDAQIAAVATYIRNEWGNDFGIVDVAAVEAERAAAE